MTRNQRKWSYGLAAAFFGGVWTSIDSGLAVMLLAPKEFNLDDHLGKTLLTMLILGLLAGAKVAVAYLKQSPLPPLNGDTEMFTKEMKLIAGLTLTLGLFLAYAKTHSTALPIWSAAEVSAVIAQHRSDAEWIPHELKAGGYIVTTAGGRFIPSPKTISSK